MADKRSETTSSGNNHTGCEIIKSKHPSIRKRRNHAPPQVKNFITKTINIIKNLKSKNDLYWFRCLPYHVQAHNLRIIDLVLNSLKIYFRSDLNKINYS